MKPSSACWMKLVLALFLALCGFSHEARAADLPLAAASPLTGVAFDDRPLLLPVQRNFQMAMLTAGSELGRSCGRMEAYGWRMSQTEQARVNQIFNNTVDRMRLLGYTIQPQTLTSVSKDITLFTADTRDKHFIFLWSAGELGLVLNLCETSAPLPSSYRATTMAEPSVQTFPVPLDVVPTRLEAASHISEKDADNFTPIGKWVGSYICAQGYTGGTLQIDRLKGQDFEGVFRFYPTPKNPSVPDGAYTVYGQYDRDSKRILVNPGKWIKRPPHYYNTVIVGSFDPMHGAFSAYFQGISGCTSFEAERADEPYYLQQELTGKSGKHAMKKKARKKPAPKKAPAISEAPVAPAATTPDMPPPPAAAPAVAVPAAPVSAPAVSTPALAPAPSAPVPVSSAAPAPVAAPVTPPADAGILLAAPSK